MGKKKTKGTHAQEAARRRAAAAARAPELAAMRAQEEATAIAERRAEDARRVAAELRRLEHAQDDVVRAVQAQERAARRARAAGASWGQIGRALGISQQAAHRRYASVDD